jgi:hypothetical protein
MEKEEVTEDISEKIKKDQDDWFNKQFDIMSENMQAVLAQTWYLTRQSRITRQQAFLLAGRCSEFIDKLLSVIGQRK